MYLYNAKILLKNNFVNSLNDTEILDMACRYWHCLGRATRTDGQTELLSISRVSVLTRDKNSKASSLQPSYTGTVLIIIQIKTYRTRTTKTHVGLTTVSDFVITI